MSDERERFGMPHVGQICDSHFGGEVVISKVQYGGEFPISLAGRPERIGWHGWGSAVWPKGMVRMAEPAAVGWRPDPAWGRKGPIVPPEPGIEVRYLYETTVWTVTKVGPDGIDCVAILTPGTVWQRQWENDIWIHSLPAGYTWPRPEAKPTWPSAISGDDGGIYEPPASIKIPGLPSLDMRGLIVSATEKEPDSKDALIERLRADNKRLAEARGEAGGCTRCADLREANDMQAESNRQQSIELAWMREELRRYNPGLVDVHERALRAEYGRKRGGA